MGLGAKLEVSSAQFDEMEQRLEEIIENETINEIILLFVFFSIPFTK
jgi:hypothetical protein